MRQPRTPDIRHGSARDARRRAARLAILIVALGVGLTAAGSAVAAVTLSHSASVTTFTNDQATWSIRTAITAAGAGPCYVSKVVTRSGRVLVDDSKGAGYVNDSEFGGLATFGFHLARRIGGRTFIDDQPWTENNAWPVDGRTANAHDGFGVRAATFLGARMEHGRGVLRCRVSFGDPWDARLATATYSYVFEPARVRLAITVAFRRPAGPTAFLKEPKLAFAVGSGGGFRSISTPSRSCTASLPVTCQSAPSGPVIFQGPKSLVIAGSAFGSWDDAAARRPSFGPVDGRGDLVRWNCYGGDPRNVDRWELIGRRTGRGAPYTSATVLMTGWEGGRGPYDCEPLSRLMVDETQHAAVTFSIKP